MSKLRSNPGAERSGLLAIEAYRAGEGGHGSRGKISGLLGETNTSRGSGE